jgi:uncharacterized protein (TIGR01777 family)
MSTVGITGGTGFIGKHLVNLLQSKGHQPVIFSRNPGDQKGSPGVNYAKWNPEKNEIDIAAMQNLDAIIHLAGAGIADKRWTKARKKEIVASRVDGTRFVIEQLRQYAPKCKTFIAASAIGFYGPDRAGVGPFTEDTAAYTDYLAKTCLLWENESNKAAAAMRTVIIRIGIVLGKEGGAFPQFAQPMSFGIMPILGSGRQMVSWINVDDLAGIMVYALEQVQMNGTYNGAAPNPVNHKQLMHAIAKAKGGLKIPVPVPAFALKIMLGEMSGEVLKSCTVSDGKTIAAGYAFKYTNINACVKAVLNASALA